MNRKPSQVFTVVFGFLVTSSQILNLVLQVSKSVRYPGRYACSSQGHCPLSSQKRHSPPVITPCPVLQPTLGEGYKAEEMWLSSSYVGCTGPGSDAGTASGDLADWWATACCSSVCMSQVIRYWDKQKRKIKIQQAFRWKTECLGLI